MIGDKRGEGDEEKEAMAAVHGGVTDVEEQPLEERFKGGGLMLITRGDDAEPIGIVEYRAGWPVRGWTTIELIALKEGERGWGYGSEAVKILEERHKGARLLAQIDPRNGLALYFWLRMGYRPARADEIFWRAPDEGGIIALICLPEEKE